MAPASAGPAAPGGPLPEPQLPQVVTDQDLERASNGVTVSIGPAGGGRPSAVPLEVYVARVIAGEGQASAPEATQQALAIAARTYAFANLRRHGRDGFDLCDGTHCQVPRAATAASRRAALATAGRVLVYRGAVAEVFYSASCGGRSEDDAQVWPGMDLPYLQPVDDDVHGDDEVWTVTRSLDEIRRALTRAGHSGRRLTDLIVEQRSESGRAVRVRTPGLRPDSVRGEALRAAIGTTVLRSTAFSIERRGRTVTFKGRGYGHGVGLCVIGAARRGQRGETADQILGTYYPGLEVRDAGSVVRTARAAHDLRLLAARH